jgi:hypothetical protein
LTKGHKALFNYAMSLTASLRALLARSIDYAGLFPPCSLGLESALKNHAHYVRSPDAWMLSAFILPVDKFDEASALVAGFDKHHPVRISALGAKTENASQFLAALKTAMEKIRAFESQHAGLVSVIQLEMLLPVRAGLAIDLDSVVLREAGDLIGDSKLQVFWEAPAELAEKTISLLARAKQPAFGYKLRTGGVTADAFPTSVQIARLLIAGTKDHVPIKFTAGLHHPVRQFRDEVKTEMHGFLNVLGAGVLSAEHHWDEAQTIAMLEDQDARGFSFEDTMFSWRDWEVSIDRIKARRKFVTSFGSCSFDEPREDLRALNLL